MKRTRHTAEQIVKKLHQAATKLAAGKTVEEVCKGLAISPATYHRWEKEYGGADVNTVRENKALKEENTRLKRLVADQALDLSLMKELVEGKWWARRAREKRWRIWWKRAPPASVGPVEW